VSILICGYSEFTITLVGMHGISLAQGQKRSQAGVEGLTSILEDHRSINRNG